jgi:hypothetical protein
VIAPIVGSGLAVARLAGAGGGYIGVAVATEELGGKSCERGALVQAIAPNSPAMLAGLVAGDVVAAAELHPDQNSGRTAKVHLFKVSKSNRCARGDTRQRNGADS